MSKFHKIHRKTKFLTNKIFNITFFLPNKTINGIITMLVKLGLHKYFIEAKLFFIISPFIFLLVVDNIVLSFIITTLNTFFCSIVMLSSNIDREQAIVDGKFDYGLYKYLLARKQNKAIVICFALTMFNILIGHFFIDEVLNFGIDFL